jgi:hypothetical protein
MKWKSVDILVYWRECKQRKNMEGKSERIEGEGKTRRETSTEVFNRAVA